MRHFVWYDRNGSLGGVHRHSGGWPRQEDLRNPQSTSQKVLRIRERMLREENFGGFAEFTCTCPPEAFMCTCAHAILHDHYFNGDVIVAKPDLVVELDGRVVDCGPAFTGTYVDLTPGSTASLVMKAVVPDGHSVEIINAVGQVPLISGTTQLTFSGGASQSVSVQVPDQGLFGIVGGQSNLIRRFALAVRGWA